MINFEGKHQVRISTEFMGGEPIYCGRCSDLGAALRTLTTNPETLDCHAIQDANDCGFIAVDYNGREHTRMIAAKNRSGHEIVIFFEEVDGRNYLAADGSILDVGERSACEVSHLGRCRSLDGRRPAPATTCSPNA